MPHNLPDEILKEILAPPLRISENDFRFSGGTDVSPFGRTFRNSTRVLLVSKQWMRVATPLLYEGVIIRSTAQAQALALAVKCNKVLGTFIKRLRMEGGFGMDTARFIAAAPNIRELVVSLNLREGDKAGGLCDASPKMNPRRLIINPGEPGPLSTKAIHLRNVLTACIRNWPHLETLEYFDLSTVYKPFPDLFNILKPSRSIKNVVLTHCPTPVLIQLASITNLESIHLRFMTDEQIIPMDINPRLRILVQYGKRSSEEPIPVVLPCATAVAGFRLLEDIPPHVAVPIWDLIFSFATFSYDFENSRMHDNCNASWWQNRAIFTSTACSLSLVSWFFHVWDSQTAFI
ncbi:hypothetical protein BD410DRAFT_835195 [Rickenella mellea]|uniref:Uncharacterized protein n=1 Tax=Rickenella mellea TaxID=50990 RepID=A0A4Y7QJT1_9AGAM|nr:hypothetical protein BD410DRAFT_835195 [Rickenella mellea]